MSGIDRTRDAVAELRSVEQQVLLDWYDAGHRPLPWRDPSCSAWGILVSEVMLQQTPVSRVLPVWRTWLERWPEPAHLAAEPPGEAISAWGRLGYPRRALRLHASAQACVDRFGGSVPETYDALRSLPGVGDYTAAAVAAFAFGQRQVVLDTNIRRVLARFVAGAEYEPPGAPSSPERQQAESVLPAEPARAARWNAAVMELGAVICTARAPGCSACPVRSTCAWLAAGSPAWDGPARRGQSYEGTDRQARGRLLGVLRDAPGAVPASDLEAAWPTAVQRERALAGLISDGLVEPLGTAAYQLPGRASQLP